ncbi:MAG: M48 family metallopeptidase [Candidatus Omnitrophota bacterium]
MPKNREAARKYNRTRVRLRLAGILCTILYLALFQFLVSGRLKLFAISVTPNFSYAFTLYLFVFSLLYYALDFPMHFYSGFILEHKFRLSRQNFFAWLKDDVKRGLLSLAIFLVFIHVLYLFLQKFAATWWIWIAVFYLFATVILARVAPLVIIPLFFKYYPVGDNLKKRIIELSGKCGIRILDVYKIDFSRKTNKLNAAVVGMGKTRRVLLADNLIENFTEDEIAGVLAHEFGHHKMLHVWKILAFGAISTFVSFYVLYVVSSGIAGALGAEHIYDMKVFPAFMLVLFLVGFLLMPLQNGFSRHLERGADLFALKAIQNRGVFISLMTKLAERNLADPNPPKLVKLLFYDHPPIPERIKMAEKFSP